jgi:penicillin-binding protein 1A
MISQIKNFLTLLFLMGLSGLAIIIFTATLIYPTLPDVESLSKYRPKEPLQIFTKDNYLIQEFGEERRDFIAIENVPQKMINAILAIEDRRFFEHPGIDFIGIVRAAVKNFTGQSREGASTITMQVARNFFLSSEKTFKRKINEILLSLKIENTLTKEEILELYINQIYLGQRSFGFSAAANTYFNKTLENLNLAEIALLAGLPKAPSRYNPLSNPDLAVARQHTVLNNMYKYGFIDKPSYILALEEHLDLVETNIRYEIQADYVAEMVRKVLYEEYGNSIYTSGLKVITTIKKRNQEVANQAVENGIINYMNRQELRAPEGFVDLDSKEFKDKKTKNQFLKKSLRSYKTYNNFIPGIILSTQPYKIEVFLKTNQYITIYRKNLGSLKKDLSKENSEDRLIKKGSVMRFVKKNKDWLATQLPDVESALISMDPNTGAIVALVGGFSFKKNKFNHVTQAHRQPGSIFKPFIISSALEKGITPSTIINDGPLEILAKDLGTNENWVPQNYNEKFSGPIRLREGLAKSKNLISIRILKHISPEYSLDYIARFGFNPKKYKPYLSMALGVGEATAWEMVRAYSVFANGGYLKTPYYIDRIIDSKGRNIKLQAGLINEETPRIIDPRNAFIMYDLLKEVITNGTARKAKILKRPDMAGKTGTTNDLIDAWFAGFNSDIVTVTWMGYDQPKSLGNKETGSRAALPIWIDYMKPLLENYPIKNQVKPEGITPLKINKKTGMTKNADEDGFFEYFYEEYPPYDNSYFVIN